MTELTYTMRDGYRIPALLPPQEPEVTIGNTACCAANSCRSTAGYMAPPKAESPQ